MNRIFFSFFAFFFVFFFGFRISDLGFPPVYATPTYLSIHIESAPKTLDPAQATGHREHFILQSLFEGLTRYDPKTLTPLPGAAERWEISEDGTSYRFYLRKGAKWSDGRPVTAQDFWNGWEHLLNPNVHSPYAFQLFYLKGAKDYNKGKLKDLKKVGMTVKDSYIFEVTLEKPVPYFLFLTAFSALAPRRKDSLKVEKITNGPFVLADQKEAEEILLLPNKYYWDAEAVKVHGVLLRPFGDFNTALKFYSRTGIDIMADLPPQQVPLLKFRSDYRAAPILRTEYFVLQTQKYPFDKKEVRQALSLSIDRQKITEEVLKRGDLPYGFLVPPGMPGYTNPNNPQTFDPWKAKYLLGKAGFGLNSPNKFPTIVLHYNNASDRRLVAEAAQEMWQKNLGIKVELLEEEWDDYLKRRQGKNFEVSWGGWYGDYPDPNTFLELFLSDNPQNHAAFSNGAYDDLVRRAQGTLDLKKRALLLQEAEGLLLREAPVIAVLAKAKNYLIQPYVRGYSPNLLDIHPLRDVYSMRP